MGRWTERLKEKQRMQGQSGTIVASDNLTMDELRESITRDSNPEGHEFKSPLREFGEPPKVELDTAISSKTTETVDSTYLQWIFPLDRLRTYHR